MAQEELDRIRAVALTLRRRCQQLYEELTPIVLAANKWALNDTDDKLPSAGQVKMQVEAYEALRKHPIRLNRDLRDIKTATSEETPLGDPLLMDGSFPFDGSEQFTGETQA